MVITMINDNDNDITSVEILSSFNDSIYFNIIIN